MVVVKIMMLVLPLNAKGLGLRVTADNSPAGAPLSAVKIHPLSVGQPNLDNPVRWKGCRELLPIQELPRAPAYSDGAALVDLPTKLTGR
jgi:hypothetical protein